MGKNGLIPARAGNTTVSLSPCIRSRAHPRSRGEHVLSFFLSFFVRGSSPLARGTPPCALRLLRRIGLIPARAGNTSMWEDFTSDTGAHPRSRGEHMEALGFFLIVWGSSPLARGTQALGFITRTARGLIPARAGNTFMCRFLRWGGWAHPRSRGEHGKRVTTPAPPWGSSPLARGTP